MTKPMIKIHNTETGEIVEREMNAQELADYDTTLQATAEAEAAKAKAEADITALLAKLGISADEAKLLLS